MCFLCRSSLFACNVLISGPPPLIPPHPHPRARSESLAKNFLQLSVRRSCALRRLGLTPGSRWAPVGRSDIERNSNGVVGRRPLPPCRAAVGGTAGAHLAERHIIFLRISSLRNELVHMYICRFLYVQSVHASKSQCGFKVSMPQNVTTLSQVRLGRFLGPEDDVDDRRQNKNSPKSNFGRPPVPGRQTILWIWLSG